VAPELIVPDWPAPASVRALQTTRSLGDMRSEQGRARLQRWLPAAPLWLEQEHGVRVADAARAKPGTVADACFARERGVVCALLVADCMPVLFASEQGGAVAIAHAGWRGLAAGVLEATLEAMATPAAQTIAWLGPAIGARAYEVGDEVRVAFLERDAAAQIAFAPSRPGHWCLDLYAVARQRLAARGVTRVSGGAYCTYSDAARFYSYRRDRAAERMAAAVWLA